MIIKSIYDEYLSDDLEVMSVGKTAHNIVFPYMKPLQAIDMVRQNLIAADMSPFFIYESFYPQNTRLDSYKRMYESEPITTLSPKISTPDNNASIGQTSKSLQDDRGAIYEYAIPSAYNTLDMMNKGAFASFVTVADPSIKKAEITDFDFRKHAPPIANDWISEFFAFNGQRVNNLYDTHNTLILQNRDAFNDDYPNINSIDDLDRNILRSYWLRHKTTNVRVYMDSIAYTPDTGEPFGVGRTVIFNMPRFSPKFSESENADDYVNSGKYIISAIRHYIKNEEYTMSVELTRDGIGENARLYPNGEQPDFTIEPRVRTEIFKEFLS